eukprot:TRINITY_DN10682_c0_g1_i1.p1 TRINITY_DN10682_c0_g1~~TRINITY_DN10682_c0_g1_i1.p1  ORF type:complete len:361 (+),score=97.92 TRINITY_DN10682_c0_g1_i1:51-1133(+)
MTASEEYERFTLEAVTTNPNLMICDGWVLDVSKFRHEHPGGPDYMAIWQGKDVSAVMRQDAVHKHTDYAFRVVESLRVGTLLGAEISARENKEFEGLVDLDKPFLPQIYRLGNKYAGWIGSQPVVRHLTIFPNALESLSRHPWWWIMVGIPPVIGFGILHSVSMGVDALTIFSSFLLGLLSWVFAEYTLHRHVFHIETSTNKWNVFHFFSHGLHHLTPHDPSRLTFPPAFTYLLAVMFWFLFKWACMGLPQHGAMFSGMVFGYLCYDFTHFLYHHTNGKRWGNVKFPMFFARYLTFMKSHHNVHHFLNDTCNFGVSSPLLDFVFGTYISKPDAEKIRETKTMGEVCNRVKRESEGDKKTQ